MQPPRIPTGIGRASDPYHSKPPPTLPLHDQFILYSFLPQSRMIQSNPPGFQAQTPPPTPPSSQDPPSSSSSRRSLLNIRLRIGIRHALGLAHLAVLHVLRELASTPNNLPLPLPLLQQTYRPLGKPQIHLPTALGNQALLLLERSADDARGDGEVAIVAVFEGARSVVSLPFCLSAPPPPQFDDRGTLT